MENNQNRATDLINFTDILEDDSWESQPISLSPASTESQKQCRIVDQSSEKIIRPAKHTGQYGDFRSVDEIDEKYRCIFSYPFFNLVQSKIIEDALYSDKSLVVCAPTGSGKTVVFEMAILQLIMKLEDMKYKDDFKIIYMAPVKAVCTERLTEWYPKFTKLGLHCIEVTGDTDVDFSHLKSYRIIITTPEKWDVLTRCWKDYKGLVGVIKLFLIDEVHILNDENRGPVLEAVVSRMKTIESSSQSAYRIERLQRQVQGELVPDESLPRIRFVAVSATVSNPEDVAAWLGNDENPAVYHKYGDECRPVKLRRVVEGYPCPEGTSIFKFDITLNYKLWPIIQKYYDGKPTLIFCNTRKSVALTAEVLSRDLTITFSNEQKAKLTALASTIKNKKLQTLLLNGVGCHHAGLLFEERINIEQAFRQRDLPILITTTTLAMGVNLPAHLVIVKNTQMYVNGAYQEYSISTVLQMVGRAGRPQFDNEATAVIMTRLQDKHRYQALVGGSEPLQSYLHKRLTENLNSEAALHTVTDVAQCVEWLRSTFLYVRAAKDPKRYLNLPPAAAPHLISKKIEELCVKAMNGLASSGLITMDEASCIESTEAGRLMSIYYLDFETMKLIMKIEGTETLEKLLWIVCESHELADMHLRVEEKRCLNTLNRSNGVTIRYPMKGKIATRQMKMNCIIQAILGCLQIPDPSLNQESMKVMRIADRVCMVAYVTRADLVSKQPKHFAAILNAIILSKCIYAHLWENSPYVSKQLKGIGPTFSTLLTTAGKNSFMLLEESHPRDLERIMNKGPPAGNALRKQISLLPKYQLTMTPIDEESVTIQLLLLNQTYLRENMQQLTAGENHTSYIVVGDSENHILLLATFKDKNLISIYDGSLTYTITRKHRFEHEIFVHCISSRYVGIDAKCNYLFKGLDLRQPPSDMNVAAAEPSDEISNKKITKRQTHITDNFKERKRKTAESDICQSKEKKKRENSLIQHFKLLKESFGTASKALKEDLKKSKQFLSSNVPIEENTRVSHNNDKSIMMSNDDNGFKSVLEQHRGQTELTLRNQQNVDEINEIYAEKDGFMDDECIDSILNEIETEISEKVIQDHESNNEKKILDIKNTKNISNNIFKPSCSSNYLFKDSSKSMQLNNTSQPEIAYNKIQAYKDWQNHTKTTKKNNNYTFMELLEKNLDLSDDEVIRENKTESGFPEATKTHLQQFFKKAQSKAPIGPNTFEEKDIPILLVSPETQCDTECSTKNYIGEEYTNSNKTDEKNNTMRQNTFVEEDIIKILELPETQCDTEYSTKKYIGEEYTNSNKTDEKHNTIGQNTFVEEDKIKILELPKTQYNTECSTKKYIREEYIKSNKIDEQNNSVDVSPETIVSKPKKYEIIEIADELPSSNENQIKNKHNEKPIEILHVNKEMGKQIEDHNSDSVIRIPKKSINTIVVIEDETNKVKFSNGETVILDKALDRKITDEIAFEKAYGKSLIKKTECVENNTSPPKKSYSIESNSQNNRLALIDYKYSTNNDSLDDKTYFDSSEHGSGNMAVKNQDYKHGKSIVLKELKSNTLSLPMAYEIKTDDGNKGYNSDEVVCVSQNSLVSKQKYPTQKVTTVNRNKPTFEPPFKAGENTKSLSELFDTWKTKTELPLNSNSQIVSDKTLMNKPCLGNIETHKLDSFNGNDPRSTNSPKNSSHEYMQYKEKYSYTATKIDIWTQEKNSEKCTLKVIKKLKVDLDITVAEEKANSSKSYQNCTHVNNIQYPKRNETLNKRNNNDVFTKIVEQQSKKPMLELLAPTAIIHKSESSHYNDDADVTKNKQLCTKTNRNILNALESGKSEQEIINVQKKYKDDVVIRKYDEDYTHGTDVQQQLSAGTNFNSISVGKSSESEKSKVNNILQKYANILRKKAETTATTSNKDTSSSELKTRRVKQKRPFNITDIHRIDTPLPKSLVPENDNRSTSTSVSLEIVKHDKKAESKVHERINRIIPAEQGIVTQCIDRTPPIEDSTTEDIPEIMSPKLQEENLQTHSNFHIDNSMLDPKALLQCYSSVEDEAEIIPPPPQFYDAGTYSPIHSEIRYNNDFLINSELNPWEDYDESRWRHNDEKSILVDDCETEIMMTPSKEIETWTFSAGEESAEISSNKFMRGNYRFSSVNRHNFSTLRRKLDDFKYNSRKKFKLT